MKKIGLAFLVLVLCLGGCAPGGGRVLDVSGERKALDEAVSGLFAALDARDGEAIQALFSPYVRERDTDMMDQVDKLLEVYPGPTTRYDWEDDGGAKQRSGGYYYNTAACTVYATCGGEDYWCWITLMYQNSDPEQVGVKSIRFFTAEEFCGVHYDDWDIPGEDGLSVYAERTLDCQVRAIRGTPTSTPRPRPPWIWPRWRPSWPRGKRPLTSSWSGLGSPAPKTSGISTSCPQRTAAPGICG